jgi:hypothetical protein
MIFPRLLLRLFSLKSVCLSVFLLFLCLIFYSFSSIHVLSIGDWPHDTLNPTYTESWIQTGWAPSVGIVPVDSLSRFDVVVCDSSVTEYLNQEPWKDIFNSYVRNGGTLILITSKNTSSSGEILKETVIDNGRTFEVVGGSSKSFWESLYISSVGYPRLLLIQLLTVVIFVLSGILVIQVAFWVFVKQKVERAS